MIEGYVKSTGVKETLSRDWENIGIWDKPKLKKFELQGFKKEGDDTISFYTFSHEWLTISEDESLVFVPMNHLQSVLNFIETLEGN